MTEQELNDILTKAQEMDALGTAQGDADRDRLLQMYQEGVEATQVTRGEDVRAAAKSGAIRGAAGTLDLGRNVLELAEGGPLSMLGRLVGFGAETLATGKVPPVDYKTSVMDAARSQFGDTLDYQPTTIEGKLAGTVSEFAGGGAVMPFGYPVKTGLQLVAAPARSALSTLLPALASETAGQMTEGTEMEGPARLAAALGTPLATSALRQGTQRALLGPEARLTQPGTARGEAVQTLEDAGVSMTTGLKAGSPRLMSLEGSLEVPLETKKTLTTATMRTMGSDSELATPAAMRDVKSRLGKVFDRADNVVDDVPSTETAIKANSIIEEHMGSSATGDIPPFLVDINDEFLNAAAGSKTISNKKLQNMRSRLRKVMNGTNDPLIYESAFKMNGVVDDFMIESVRRTQPKLVPELMEAREQYRNYLTTMRALKTRGSDSAGGYISPAMLSGALRSREGDRYILGTGSELANLGRAAEEVVSSMPAVQAGGRRSIAGGGGILGAGGGAYAATQMGMDPVPAMMIGGAAGAAIPAAGRKAITSAPMQSLLMPTQDSVTTQMLLDALRSGARQSGGLLSIPR
jgi:hypothetical protein